MRPTHAARRVPQQLAQRVHKAHERRRLARMHERCVHDGGQIFGGRGAAAGAHAPQVDGTALTSGAHLLYGADPLREACDEARHLGGELRRTATRKQRTNTPIIVSWEEQHGVIYINGC